MHILIAALHRPTKPTGVCRHAANLALCLANTDRVTKVTLVIGAWQKDYFATSFALSSEKIELVSVDIKNSSLARNAWFLFGLPQLTTSLRPDLVHLSFPLPFLRQWFQSPVVSTIHDLYPYEYPENFGYPQVWFNRWFLKQCVSQSDGLICVSKTTLEALKNYFQRIDSRRNAVIYNYVDLSQIAPRKPESIAAAPDFRFLLSVGQHRKNKNLDLLLQAYALLLTQNRVDPATKLLIVGSSGPETQNLQDLIQTLKLQNQVILLNSIGDEELCWLYKHCDLFVIPSSTEGFCLPLVEALSLSCSVVCSDIPIFREVGSLHCNYFNLANQPVNSLTETIANTLQHPDSDQRFADARFTKETVAKQLLDFYTTVL